MGSCTGPEAQLICKEKILLERIDRKKNERAQRVARGGGSSVRLQ
jgi:hypothetical protein